MQSVKENYSVYLGDSIEVLKQFPESSIDYSIFSPPFINLYTYTAKSQDIGNCKTKKEFDFHFDYFVNELKRVIRIGRLVSVHCAQVPAMKERDGYLGLKDFRGDIIRLFEKHGFTFHSEVAIWKDPLIEVTRSKTIGLLHKQLCKDSSVVRQGLMDYILTFKKPGKNDIFINHDNGIGEYEYFGKKNIDKMIDEKYTEFGDLSDDDKAISIPRETKRSHLVWREYASPIWMDIRQTRTLNTIKYEKDEKHICPLQLDTIGRCLVLWSNPGELVLDPFNGIGSTGYQSLILGRKYVGIELKEEYYNQTLLNLEKADNICKTNNKSLFD